jgi:hypothetical protein
VRSRERDDSRGPLALFFHFLPFTLPKILLGYSKKIDDSGCPQAQQIIFASLVYKHRLVDFEKTIIQVVA